LSLAASTRRPAPSLATLGPVAEGGRTWNFVTSHGVALIEVYRDPNATVREISERVGVTERQAHRVLSDLVSAGYLTRRRIGRRNAYCVNEAKAMRHPAVSAHHVGELLSALAPPPRPS
jgi:DNA-binding transcriptional ArsR family regulator